MAIKRKQSRRLRLYYITLSNKLKFQFGISKGGVNVRVGAILKACRTRAGLNQEELAHSLHINQSDVSKYENDTKEPPLSILQAWTNNTQTQEVMVAFICGMDGLNILQKIIDAGMTLTILGGIL